MTRQVVILAGGLGTRLRTVTGGLPKALAPVGGIPVLEHQLRLCARHGFNDVHLLLGFGSEQIQEFVGDGKKFGVRCQSLIETKPLGTAGAVLSAEAVLTNRFLVMYCDTMLDIDLGRFWESSEIDDADASLVVHPNDHPFDSDLVVTDKDGWILEFSRWNQSSRPLRNLASAALYVIKRDALKGIRTSDDVLDFGRHVFPRMIAAGLRLKAYRTVEYIKDIGTPERLRKVNADFTMRKVDPLASGRPRATVFLDRDGVINEEVDGVLRPQDIRLLPGVSEAIRSLNEAGFPAIVITNQPYVSHGSLTEAQLDEIHAFLEAELASRHAVLDAIYYCPHHPHGGYDGERKELKIQCQCRKPLPGMIFTASRELHLDLPNSWMIGDRTADVAAGAAAGVRTVMLRSGHAGRDGQNQVEPDFRFADLKEAAYFITVVYPRMKQYCQDLIFRGGADVPRTILLGGQARSGKSTWAKVLRDGLSDVGLDTVILSLDNWLLDLGARGTNVLQRYELGPVSKMLEARLQSDEPFVLSIPIYDRQERRRLGERLVTIHPKTTLIVEGVLALLLKDSEALRLYTCCSDEVRQSRFKAFYHDRGEDELADHYWQLRLEDEVSIVENSRVSAMLLPDINKELGE